MKNILAIAITLALTASSAVAAATPHRRAESNPESVQLQRRNHGLLSLAAGFVPGPAGTLLKWALPKRSDSDSWKREVGLTNDIEERDLDLEYD